MAGSHDLFRQVDERPRARRTSGSGFTSVMSVVP